MPARRPVIRRLPAGALVLAFGSLVGVSTVPGSSGATSAPLVLTGYGSSTPSGPAPGDASPGAGPHATALFSIAGSVTGLYPGVTRPLVLTVTNHDTVTIIVNSITTAVSNATTTCLAGNVKVTAFSGSLVLAAGKAGKVTVQATMVHAAPNACQGKSFPFHYTGVAS